MNKIDKKTIGDLYNEAIRHANERPAVIQPDASNTNHLATRPYSSLPSQNVEPRLATHLQTSTDSPSASQVDRPPLFQSGSWANSDSWSNLLQQPNSSVILASAVGPQVSHVVHAAEPPALEKGTINEDFDQTDVREAIQVLASNSNHTVVVDDTLGGVTSAHIQDATFDVALAKILAPLGFYYSFQEGTYYVAPPDPDSPLFPKIAKRYQYSPLHHDNKVLLPLLPPRYKKFISSSDSRNLILIDAPPEIGEEIMVRIREMDTPVAQIELEAIVCVVAPDSGFRFGLDWNHVVGVNGVDSFKAGITGLSFSGSTSQAGARNAFSDFAVTSAFVRLLAQEGYITIRAAPRVTTKDGEKANIAINRETFFSLQGSAANAFFSPAIQKVEAGISLEITPRLHGDMISVNIAKAEVSEDIRSSDAVLTSNPYPIINRRTVSTNVNVPEGHTIVIGGLVQRQTVERVNRIPILSKIPLAGRLFQTIEKQEQDAEVAIFISPKLVVDNYACRESSSFSSVHSETVSQAP
jgi:type IV pilus assembly protein PilQ